MAVSFCINFLSCIFVLSLKLRSFSPLQKKNYTEVSFLYAITSFVDISIRLTIPLAAPPPPPPFAVRLALGSWYVQCFPVCLELPSVLMRLKYKTSLTRAYTHTHTHKGRRNHEVDWPNRSSLTLIFFFPVKGSFIYYYRKLCIGSFINCTPPSVEEFLGFNSGDYDGYCFLRFDAVFPGK